MIYKIT